MTEEEIMKVLAYCKNQGLTSECTECPYKGEKRDCMGVMLEDALDLINRKNAENARLNFENLQMIASINGLEERARAEAIKEFIERAKTRFTIPWCGSKYDVIYGWFAKIAKEMGVETNV